MTDDTELATAAKKSNGQWVAPGTAVELQERVVSTATELYSSFRQNAGKFLTNSNSQSVRFVRRYPLQATAGALVIGLFLGAALRRIRT